MDIKIKLDTDIWVPARNYQIEAFKNFKNIENPYIGEKRYEYNNNGIKFTVDRIGDKYHGGIYLIREDGTQSPIADWNDVKVFLLNKPNVNWYSANPYQTRAYFDFVYGADTIRKYKSKGTRGYLDHIEIDIDGILSGIIFTIMRNDNGTICYENNDAKHTQIRISDNEQARRGYLGFYHRITDDYSNYL